MTATARIGVVADTHVGEWLAELPHGVLDALAGVDLILHAGDITQMAVLGTLARIAPVIAVQGDHDRGAGIALPASRVIEVAGYRIGLTHGRRPRRVELAAGLLSLIARRPVLLGVHGTLRRRFGDVDSIVYGHLHLPCVRRRRGVLFFSPGAVHNAERVPGFAAGGITARRYLSFRRSLPSTVAAPAVGIIDAGPDGLHARIVRLDAA